jgi:hypothetical protein
MVWAVSLSTTKLSPRRLTPRVIPSPFTVWLGLVSSRPLAHPVSLPAADSAPGLPESYPWAAPKCISGRTSYLRVRLAFHLYPQLIQQFCNTGRFGPPSPFRETSPWPWVAHPVSGPIAVTRNKPSPLGLPRDQARPSALFRLAFAKGSVAEPLNQKANDDQLAGSFFNRHAIRSPTRLFRKGSLRRGPPRRGSGQALPSDCLWATGFRFSFTPRTGVLFTFPSRYSFAIGRFGYLALERGRPCFPRDSSCPAVLKSENKSAPNPSPTGLSPSLARPFPGSFG